MKSSFHSRLGRKKLNTKPSSSSSASSSSSSASSLLFGMGKTRLRNKTCQSLRLVLQSNRIESNKFRTRIVSNATTTQNRHIFVFCFVGIATVDTDVWYGLRSKSILTEKAYFRYAKDVSARDHSLTVGGKYQFMTVANLINILRL